MTHEATKANRRLTNDEVRIMKERVFDLEARLIAFAVRVIKLVEALPKTPAGNHIRNQLLRSGTSPAPHRHPTMAKLRVPSRVPTSCTNSRSS